MSEQALQEIAKNAKFVINKYAFSKRDDGLISILNLAHPDSAMVVSMDGILIETNMGEIEQKIVLDLCKRNLQFVEV